MRGHSQKQRGCKVGAINGAGASMQQVPLRGGVLVPHSLPYFSAVSTKYRFGNPQAPHIVTYVMAAR